MKELFANEYAGMIGLLFFFFFFVGMLIWLFRPGAKDKYKKYGEIPLNKDKEDE